VAGEASGKSSFVSGSDFETSKDSAEAKTCSWGDWDPKETSDGSLDVVDSSSRSAASCYFVNLASERRHFNLRQLRVPRGGPLVRLTVAQGMHVWIA